MEFRFNDLIGQFRVVERAASEDGANTYALRSLSIESIGEIDICRVFTSEGQEIGALVGKALDLATGSLLGSRLELGHQDIDKAVEEIYERLAGSFLLLTDRPNERRVYLDCIGGMPFVYDPSGKLAGSTAGMILDNEAYQERFDEELFAQSSAVRDPTRFAEVAPRPMSGPRKRNAHTWLRY